VFFGTINRMILAELVKVFLMSLIALTGMFLLAGLIQEATKLGLSPFQILMAIPLIIPNTLPFTIPATTLFATCVVYGRMSSDNEVLVLRAAGVNIYYLLVPALTLGILTTAATAALYYDPIPRSQRLLQNRLLADGEQILYSMIKRDGGMRQNNLEFVLFVREVQGRDLVDVVVKKRRKDRLGYELVARSQTASLRIRKVAEGASTSVDADEAPEKAPDNVMERFGMKLKSQEGADRYELVVRMTHCFVDSLKGETAAEVRNQEYATPLPESIFGKPTKDRPSSQTWLELFENRAELQEELEEMRAFVADLEKKGKAPINKPGFTFADSVTQYREGPIKRESHLLRQTEVEIQMRPALAVGCLCFVLIGCPVGIWASRSDYLSVFIICFLPTVFLYYPLLLASLNLAKNGKVQPPAAWAADAIVGIGSLILIQRLMKR
jgi:lipopolysaccharide export system permease protein